MKVTSNFQLFSKYVAGILFQLLNKYENKVLFSFCAQKDQRSMDDKYNSSNNLDTFLSLDGIKCIFVLFYKMPHYNSKQQKQEILKLTRYKFFV